MSVFIVCDGCGCVMAIASPDVAPGIDHLCADCQWVDDPLEDRAQDRITLRDKGEG